MRRLALLAGAELDPEARAARREREPGIGRYFAIGLTGGAAAGALALLTVHLAGMEPDVKLAPLAAAWSSWAAPAVAASRPIIPHEPTIDAFDMPLQRASGSTLAFPLRIVGPAEAVNGLVLRDLPPGVQFSRGEQRDDTTWVVNVAELPYLTIALADGAPDTFQMRIDVLARPEVAASTSIARVRIVDVPSSPPEAAPAKPAAPAAPAPAATPPSAPTAPVTAAADAPVLKRTAVAPRPAPRAERPARPSPPPAVVVAPEPERQAALVEAERHWPERASGLGAIARPSERQVWWKLPAPTWSPFQDIARR